jgi:hypothetical protein
MLLSPRTILCRFYIRTLRILRQVLASRRFTKGRKINPLLNTNIELGQIPVAARSKMSICGRSLAGTVGSNPV